MRKRLYEIIEVSQGKDHVSLFYDIIMMFTIIVSIVPLAFKESNNAFNIIEIITTVVFIIDYLARLITADYKLHNKSMV